MAEVNAPAKNGSDELPSKDEIDALLKRAAKGDKSTLPQLRAVFDRDPGYRRLFNIGTFAKEALIAPVAGKNVAVEELMKRKMQEIADKLAGPNPTFIERLLADRAAFCWHVVNHYERNYAMTQEITLKQAAYHQARIDAAHKRYLSALKTLATVRKLALPAIQVNIGENQVNVAGS